MELCLFKLRRSILFIVRIILSVLAPKVPPASPFLLFMLMHIFAYELAHSYKKS